MGSFTYTKDTEAVKLGPVELSVKQKETINVPVWAGIGAAIGGISGGAFNPAVAVGITVLGLSAPAFLWVFIVANLLGGAAAGFLFNALDLGDDKALTATPEEQARLRTAAET